jgi:hypothetical protein
MTAQLAKSTVIDALALNLFHPSSCISLSP